MGGHKQSQPEAIGEVACVQASIFGEALTAGKAYALIEYDASVDRVRVRNNQGRLRWYPADCFIRVPATSPLLLSFTLDDSIADPTNDCIEVTIHLTDGRRRWCYVTTARWLLDAVNGNVQPKRVEKAGLSLLQVTSLATHLIAGDALSFRMISVPHMIIVSELSEAVIAETLGHLAGQRRLEQCTCHIDG